MTNKYDFQSLFTMRVSPMRRAILLEIEIDRWYFCILHETERSEQEISCLSKNFCRMDGSD
jgi:hypothetical protein